MKVAPGFILASQLHGPCDRVSKGAGMTGGKTHHAGNTSTSCIMVTSSAYHKLKEGEVVIMQCLLLDRHGIVEGVRAKTILDR